MNNKPYLIAGPCSAESEEQVMKTAIALKAKTNIDVFRAGIWKPRTNPGGFEGIGLIGLSWLLNVKKETGLKTGVEVATAEHVDNALQFDTDVLWIGARTTVNPFSVQEIAEALKGTKKQVLIKNPVNPDLKLWAGAVERLKKEGVDNIGLIHRGFTAPTSGHFRNAPMWQIAIEMKRLFPELMMISDPSHICGNRVDLQEIASKSLNLGYQGLMIETHINPDEAWTDKNQQINPDQLAALMANLSLKETKFEEKHLQELSQLREQINLYDDELLHLLKNRFDIALKIGQLKKENQVAVYQTNRWNEILERMITKGNHLDLSAEFIQNLMESIHMESIKLQDALKDEKLKL